MFGLGVPELLIILVLVLFLFGGKKIPEMGKGIGELAVVQQAGLLQPGDGFRHVLLPRRPLLQPQAQLAHGLSASGKRLPGVAH